MTCLLPQARSLTSPLISWRRKPRLRRNGLSQFTQLVVRGRMFFLPYHRPRDPLLRISRHYYLSHSPSTSEVALETQRLFPGPQVTIPALPLSPGPLAGAHAIILLSLDAPSLYKAQVVSWRSRGQIRPVERFWPAVFLKLLKSIASCSGLICVP